MSELLTDVEWWSATRYPNIDDDWSPAVGRHAYNEDAALTPIFHALTRGGWRSRQHEAGAAARTADPLDQFRRDPLSAPIPGPGLTALPGGRQRSEHSESGRHHRTRETGRRR